MRTVAFASLWALACQHVCAFVVTTPALRQQGRSSCDARTTSALSMKAGPNPKASISNALLFFQQQCPLKRHWCSAAVVAYSTLYRTSRLHTTAVIRVNGAETLCLKVARSFATLETHFDVRRVSGCALAQRRS